ncbi:uncharacterized protein RJT20DRAFT_124410 [Scheffersomyces xylosifermentans]|uniref:uncharacterized protein n=1 Tax=Scheffersomyces xylosifermentans TaxID=1304137 RepID=UPI00315C6690
MDEDDSKFLLTELQEPDAIHHSLYTWLGKSKFIVLARKGRIELLQPDINSRSLKKHSSITHKNAILALAPFGMEGLGKSILTLDENYCISLLFKPENGPTTIRKFLTLNPRGQQFSVDSNPILVAESSETPTFFVLHCFQGLIHIGTIIESESSKSRLPKKRKRKSVDLQITPIPIGTVVVSQITLLHSGNIMAMLYRDFNFNYSLRYYQVDMENKSLILVKQFEEFEGAPTCIVAPLQGGIFALTCTRIFYFPDYDKKVYVSEDQSVVQDIKRNLVIKDLTQTMSKEIAKETFIACEIIDASRILVTSITGSTFIIYFKATFQAKSVSVEQLSFIELGKSTIPLRNGLHHISENLFFQTSKSSRSVLFEVHPHKPFILINSFIDSSPPILDIGIQKDDKFIDLLTSQGGEYGTEIRKHYKSKGKIRSLSCHHCTFTPRRIIYLKEKNHLILNDENSTAAFDLQDDDLTVIGMPPEFAKGDELQYCLDDGGNSLKVTTKGMYINGIKVLDEDIVLSKVSKDGSYVLLNREGDLTFYRNSQPFTLEPLNSISCLDLIQLSESEHLIVICNWEGQCTFFLSSDSISTESVSLGLDEGILSVALIRVELSKDQVVLILSLQCGELFVGSYNYKTGSIVCLNRYSLSHLPLRIIRNDNDDILLYNKDLVVGLQQSPAFDQWVPYRLSESMKDVQELSFLTNDRVAAFHKGVLKVYALQQGFSNSTNQFDSYFSPDLCSKCMTIPNSKYMIGIFIGSEYDDYEGVKRYTYLQLIDTSKMKLLHRFSLNSNNDVEMVDICILPNQREEDHEEQYPAFVVLVNNNSNKPILEFAVRKKSIKLIQECNIAGFQDFSKVSLQCISLLDKYEQTFNVSGNVNFQVQVNTSPAGLNNWSLVSDTLSVMPVFSTSQCVLNKTDCILADVINGLLLQSYSDKDEEHQSSSQTKMIPLKLQLTHNLVTSVDVSHPEVYIISGDSLGNVSVYNAPNREQVAAFNLGDQVNVVKAFPPDENVFLEESKLANKKVAKIIAYVGTVNGGLYAIHRVNGKHLESLTSTNDSRDWKVLVKNNDGIFLRKEAFGVYDSSQILEALQSGKVQKLHNKETVDLLKQYYLECNTLLQT